MDVVSAAMAPAADPIAAWTHDELAVEDTATSSAKRVVSMLSIDLIGGRDGTDRSFNSVCERIEKVMNSAGLSSIGCSSTVVVDVFVTWNGIPGGADSSLITSSIRIPFVDNTNGPSKSPLPIETLPELAN